VTARAVGAALGLAAAWAGLLACAGRGRAVAGCPVEPMSVAGFADALPLRVQMRLSGAKSASGLEAVASLESGELVVIGLGPFGMRLFMIRQPDGAPRVEERASPRLGPPPLWVFDALYRIFWIRAPGGSASPGWEHGGERVAEGYQDGRRWRRFARPGGGGEGVVIEYPGEAESGGGASITIRNPWCGYEGRVVALEGPGAVDGSRWESR